MKPKALIFGASGKTGIPVVELASQAGLDVRAVIRREDDRSERLRQAGAIRHSVLRHPGYQKQYEES